VTRRTRGVAGLALGILLLGIAGVVWFVRNPLRALELAGRGTLRASGLRPGEMTGPRGRIFYYSGGDGPTVIFLHGVNDQAGGWARIAPALLARHRVVVADLPGHGESAPADGPLSLQDVFEGVDALVAREAGAGPVTLVGNSMGGWLALRVALERPRAVSQVVLVNGTALTVDAARIHLVPRDRAEAARGMAAAFGPQAPPPAGFVLDDLVRRAPTSPAARILKAPLPAPLDDHLGAIGVPVTLVWGEADGILDLDYAKRVAERLTRARLVTLPGCGHMPQRQCPERLVPALADALGRDLLRTGAY